MKRRTNLINNALSLLLTMGAFFAVIYFCDLRYVQAEMITVILYVVVGAIIAGIFNAFAHEFGHVIAGKKNGFVLSSVTVWFFRWSRIGKHIRFDFVMIGDEAGYTEMIPTVTDNLSKRFKAMTLGGIISSFILMLVGIPALFVTTLPLWLFCVWAMFLPIGAYYFFGNALPMISYGARNDGAVVYGLNKQDDNSKVTVALLAIQAELYNGKTPKEIDKQLYFDLPQLPEDDLCFTMLLNARYNYYLDIEDFDNAKKTSDRLLELVEYMPKAYKYIVQADALYNACTFAFDEDVADDLMYELEKYLNSVNSATNLRVKLAYVLYVKKEKEGAQAFYKRGLKVAAKMQIKGLEEFEKALYERIKIDLA